MKRRLAWVAAAILIGAAVVSTRWPPISDVTTGQTPEYPDLQPGRYPQDPNRVFAAVRAVASQRRGWQITAADSEQRVLQAVARVPLTPFRDDVTVNVESDPHGSRVVVRSRSRIGRADLGVNARRIRAFLRALQRELGV